MCYQPQECTTVVVDANQISCPGYTDALWLAPWQILIHGHMHKNHVKLSYIIILGY